MSQGLIAQSKLPKVTGAIGRTELKDNFRSLQRPGI